MVDRVPLEYPLYGASFGEAVDRFRRKLFVFSGRASRSEFWWAMLAEFIVSTVIATALLVVWFVVLLAAMAPLLSEGRARPEVLVPSFVGPFVVLYGLIFVVAILLTVSQLGITARRLHDAGFSALWMLLYLVPYANIAVLVMCILGPKPEGMRFDPHPTYGAAPVPSSTIRS